MFSKRFFYLCAFGLLCAVMLAGCASSNAVRMLYKPADNTILPPPGAPRVTVVQFTDKRKDTNQLGQRRDNSYFIANAPVPEWLSRSLADELARHPLQVSYATTLDQARSGNPDYLVTGVINEVWLKESSATETSASIRANVTVSSRKSRIMNESFSAAQTRKALPSSSTAEELLSDTLQELVRPAANKVEQTISANK